MGLKQILGRIIGKSYLPEGIDSNSLNRYEKQLAEAETKNPNSAYSHFLRTTLVTKSDGRLGGRLVKTDLNDPLIIVDAAGRNVGYYRLYDGIDRKDVKKFLDSLPN
jgi:hypothetical protein